MVMGGFAGLVIWLFLKFLSVGTTLLWDIIPERIQIPYYPVLLCGIAWIFAGIVRKKYGDYPEELSAVMEKIKKINIMIIIKWGR